MAFQLADQLPGFDVPEGRLVVERGRDQVFPVRTEGQRSQRAVLLELSLDFVVLDVEEHHAAGGIAAQHLLFLEYFDGGDGRPFVLVLGFVDA